MLRLLLLLLSCLISVVQTSSSQNKSNPIKVALVQAELKWGDIDANLKDFEQRVDQCKDCDLIVFPELFTSGCEMKKRDPQEKKKSKDKIAARYPEIVNRMQKWAQKSQALIIGSTIYKENGKYYNRLLAVFPNGDYKIYDKHNCFNKGSFSSGKDHLVLNWKNHRFSTFICYDLRFPEWSRNDNNYETAIYIANWPASRHTDWEKLLQQRAKENQANVIAVNCAGKDPFGKNYQGGSCIINASGKKIIQCKDYKENIAFGFIP